MLKTIFAFFISLAFALSGTAQKLETFTVTLQPKAGANSYLSVSQKKSFNASEAAANKSTIDIGLVVTPNGSKEILEWYNLSGKDDKIPADVVGTTTGIAGLGFDKDLFQKCNTSQDLQRMTTHITPNSFVHFGSVTDEVAAGVKYHCFLLQLQNGKRALLWVESTEAGTYKVTVKKQ